MIDVKKETEASKLRGSLLEFTRFFLKYLTQRDYILSQPKGRESHQIIICRELTKLTRLQIPSQRLTINVPPGHGKSLHVSMWIAWCFTHYPDCNFLYISYSHELASKHTSFIKQIMSSAMYQHLFDVKLRYDSRAKDHFMTEAGGAVAAFGSGGAITGRDAGLPGLDRFSGAVVMDDTIKPDEANSDAIRKSVIKNYEETIRQRVRGINVPIVNIGQRLHEDDIGAFLLSDRDTRKWDSVILKAIDEAGNALYPEVNPLSDLLAMEKKSPYVFASQYQQDPLPAGGGLYKTEDFIILDEEPDIKATFITADTAETSKSYNDATVFSFWGIYEIESLGRKTGDLGLHWLDCQEIRIEPKHLKDAFIDFWQECMTHKVIPRIAAIEKKSTGATLVSVLGEMRGLTVRAIERSRASGSKTDRFLQMQPLVASKLISFTKHARHAQMCIEHMSKITANDTHRHDDICDTAYDAVKIALIDKTIYSISSTESAKIGPLGGLNKRIAAGMARNYENGWKA
jgi:predicted phage terminase large subunit-like protein